MKFSVFLSFEPTVKYAPYILFFPMRIMETNCEVESMPLFNPSLSLTPYRSCLLRHAAWPVLEYRCYVIAVRDIEPGYRIHYSPMVRSIRRSNRNQDKMAFLLRAMTF